METRHHIPFGTSQGKWFFRFSWVWLSATWILWGACQPVLLEPPPVSRTCTTSNDCPTNLDCIEGACSSSIEQNPNETPIEYVAGDGESVGEPVVERTDGSPRDVPDVAGEPLPVDASEPSVEPFLEPSTEPVAPDLRDAGGRDTSPVDVEPSVGDAGEPVVESAPETQPDVAPGCTPGARRSCFTGPPIKRGVGECQAGVEICDASGKWSTCQNQILPLAEVCNGKDDDCNGLIDDGLAPSVAGCTPSTKEANTYCSMSRTVCENGKASCSWRTVRTLLKEAAGLSEGRLAPCKQSSFRRPHKMVFGPLGHLYVTDRLGHTIRRLDAQTGQVTTIAGRDGRPGSADGPGSSARFYQPHGIAVDAQGRLFVVDRYNYTIRMIEWVDNATCFKTNNYTGYCVTTIAGRRGLVGAVNGPGSVAQFHHPVDVALDRQGGLFVADYSNHQIRRISWVTNAPCGAVASHTGVCVTTYVGSRTAGLKDALGGAAQFRGPHGVATDAKGVLYVADYQNHAIRKVDLQGNVTTLVGGVAGYRDGTAAIARLNGPMGLTVDAKGELYVAEYFNDVLRRVSTNGTVSTTTGKVNDTTFRNGLLLDARLHEPTGVAIAPDGRIVIADSNNEVLRVIELSRVRTLAGRPGAYGGDDGDALCAQMRLPIHAVRDHLGNIYVADYENHVIYRITNGRDVELFAGADSRTANHRDGHRLQAWFYAPTGLAVDAAGNVYVADSRNHVIRKIDVRSQMVSTFAGIPKSSGRADNRDKAKATFDEPMALVFGPKGHLYVADMGNDCLRKIDGTTNVVKVWAGKCGSSGDKDGKIGTARLHGPRGLVATPAGELYVADHYNHKVKKVDTTGQLSGVAGSRSGYVDGTGNKAQFSYPWHLLRLPNGNVLVADPNNHRIRHLDVSTGVVTKRAGVRTPGSRDNFALNSSFYRPRGLALFNDLGDVLVVDSLNRTLRVVPGCP